MTTLLLALLLALAQVCTATDLYVAPSGSDSAAGTEAAPHATLDHALAVSANGDRILLQRGGTWRGTFIIAGNRQLLAYGSGAEPVITGSSAVAMTGTWAGNSAVKTAAVPATVLGLWVNGVFQPLARYPNSGYLWTDTGTTLDMIRGSSMPSRSAGRWTGAQVRWHRWHWFWETRPIASDTGGSDLNLTSNATWETGLIGIPSGFYVDNTLSELDAPGEWFWGGGTLYVYPPAGVDPATMTVEVATTTNTINVNGATLGGLAFRRFQGVALTVNASSTIEDCLFEEIEDTAISTTYNSTPNTIRRCVFRDIRNIAIDILENPANSGTLMQRNLLHRVGMERGYGGSGPWHSVGIRVNIGTGTTSSLNRIVDTGYAGILLGNNPGNTANRNIIVRPMSTMNDGGGIYTYKGSNTLTENIILDSRGDLTAAEPFLPLGNGIWPEFLDGIANSVMTDNTVAGCNGNGIFLPNNFTCTISRNVCYDNLRGGLDLEASSATAQGHTIEDNVLASVSPTRRFAPQGNFASWWNQGELPASLLVSGSIDFGAMRRTTFIASSSGVDVVRNTTTIFSTLAEWSAAYPTWAENSGSVVRGYSVLLINDSEIAANVAVPAGTWTRADGSPVGATVPLAPFRSLVLVGSSPPPASPVYTVASGIDWRAATPTTQILLPQPVMSLTRAATSILDGGSDAISPTVAGTSTTLTYTIANLGTSTLTITLPVTVSSLTNCSISQTDPVASIAAGGSANLVLGVTPTSAGAWSLGVSLANNDSARNPYDWTVSGTATATPTPAVAVSRGGSIADGGSDTFIGATQLLASTVTYVVANQGSSTLTTSSATIPSLSGCTASVSTAPAASMAMGTTSDLVVTVTPSASSWSCTVQFACNDPNVSLYNWTLSGSAALAAPEIALSRGGSTIADGGIDTTSGGTSGSALPVLYTIGNLGTATLNLTEPTFSGASNCTVTIAPLPGTSVLAGQSTTLSIQVIPTSNAAWSVALAMINDDANENPTSWTLQGTATAGGSAGAAPGAGGGGCGVGGALAGLLLAAGMALGLRRRR